jgi:thiamine kinase-like enzyme
MYMLRQSKASWSTLIHGDYKAANLFFAHDGEEDHSAVAAVDFQYSGAGVPAEDVAYVLFPDAFVDYWQDESTLLEYYHQQLTEALVVSNKGGPSSLPLKSFVRLYQLSRIELLTYWLQKGWVASTRGDAQLVVAVEQAMDDLDGGKVLSGSHDYLRILEEYVGSSK